MAVDESTIQTRIVKGLVRVGAKAIVVTVTQYTERGTPDIIGSYCGRAFAIEVKTEDDRSQPEPKQLYELRKWSDSGAVVCIARSWEDAYRKVILVIDNEQSRRRTPSRRPSNDERDPRVGGDR